MTDKPMPWRCYYCDEVFTDEKAAAEHFGTRQSQHAACTIDIITFRAMEDRMAAYDEDDAEIHRRMATMETKHSSELRTEEEKGYARGLRDAQKHPETLGLAKLSDLQEWAVASWVDGVKHRPMTNIYRDGYDRMWRSVMERLGVDHVARCGPKHSDLLLKAFVDKKT